MILYLHGNAGSLRSWGAVAPDFVARGYDVLMVDYRGYGQSGGSIAGEAQLHADMAAVYAWVAARYPEERIVLYGRSLGSALAARLAAARPAPRAFRKRCSVSWAAAISGWGTAWHNRWGALVAWAGATVGLASPGCAVAAQPVSIRMVNSAPAMIAAALWRFMRVDGS